MNEDKLKCKMQKEWEWLELSLENNDWSEDDEFKYSLIKYVRQLEKEAKEDECPYCNIIAIQSKTIAELLSALKNIAEIAGGITNNKGITDLIITLACDAYNKHSTEGGG